MEREPLKKNNKVLNVARILRRNMTRQEKHLWYDFLRYYPVKIYKQRIIDNFIADFYCHSARLVIELDGSQHYTNQGKAHDEARSKILERYGIYVLRFSNKDVDDNFEGVCKMIDRVINERIEKLPCKALSPAIAGALPKGEPLDTRNLRGMGFALCLCNTKAKLVIKI